jgi:hypothetical protein
LCKKSVEKGEVLNLLGKELRAGRYVVKKICSEDYDVRCQTFLGKS